MTPWEGGLLVALMALPLLIKLVLPKVLTYILSTLLMTNIEVDSIQLLKPGFCGIVALNDKFNLRIKAVRFGMSWSFLWANQAFLVLKVSGVRLDFKPRVDTPSPKSKTLKLDWTTIRSKIPLVFIRSLLSWIFIRLKDINVADAKNEFQCQELTFHCEKSKLFNVSCCDNSLQVVRDQIRLNCTVPRIRFRERETGDLASEDIQIHAKVRTSSAVKQESFDCNFGELSFKKLFSKALADGINPDLVLEGKAMSFRQLDKHDFSLECLSLELSGSERNMEISNVLFTTTFFGEDNMYLGQICSATAMLSNDERHCLLLDARIWKNGQSNLISVDTLEFSSAEKQLSVKSMMLTPSKTDLGHAVEALNYLKSLKRSLPKAEESTTLPITSLDLRDVSMSLFEDDNHFVDLRLQCQVVQGLFKSAKSAEISLKCVSIHDSLTQVQAVETVTQLGLVWHEGRFKVIISSEVVLNWHPYLHEHISQWLQTTHYPAAAAAAAAAASDQRPPVDLKKTKLPFDFALTTKEFKVNAHCNKTLLTMNFKALSMSIKKENLEWKLNCPESTFDLNSHEEILRITYPSLSYSRDKSDFRADMETKKTLSNDCLCIAMAHLSVKFPYEFDIHEAISDDVLGYFKWAKKLYNQNKVKSSGVKLAPDIAIFTKSLSIELPDDPFEVALRENFELMEDEYYESEKRRKCLRDKIHELRASHIMLPTDKVEELNSNLSKKNSDIYIQRSRNLRQQDGRRTRLLEFSLTAMKFLIISDETMTNVDDLKRFLKNTEKDSKLPEGWEVSTFYLRWLRLECKSASIRLRDFTQPLVEMNHVLLWGKAALAEQVSQAREIRTQRIPKNHPKFGASVIQRGLQSYKLFTKLAMDMSFFGFYHGPCWEPVLSQVSNTISFVTGLKRKDPSPPLPWWDKCRYFLHGRLVWSVKLLKLFMHTSLDPYNTTEEIELKLSDANLKFSDGASIKVNAAALEIFARTASKYDDIRLLHVPKAELVIEFAWNCIGDPRDHYSVTLCTRDNVPDFSSHTQHDSYRSYRSRNVNVKLNLGSRSAGSPRASAAERATIHSFSSTVRWLESLKWLFSGTSRPIRRGKVFNSMEENVRRKSFFRHLKEIKLALNFHQLELDYWMSAAMTKGVLVRVTKGLSLNGNYQLRLVANEDGLVRRPKSELNSLGTNCQIDSTEVSFQCCSTNPEGGEGNNPNPKSIEKNFFFAVDNVLYEKTVTSDDKTELSVPFHKLVVRGAKCAWTISNRDMTYSLYESWVRAQFLREQLSTDALRNLNKANNSLRSPEVPPQPPPMGTLTKKKDDLAPSDELSISNFSSWKGTEVVLDPFDQGGCPTVYDDQDDSFRFQNSCAVVACTKDDLVRQSWLIKFVNGQVLLKGSETRGYLILSAGKAEAKKNIHEPVWKAETMLSKTSWSGALENMQYFATVSPNNVDPTKVEEVAWLPVEALEDKGLVNQSGFGLGGLRRRPGVAIVDDGYGTVGGVVNPSQGPEQLQRIVSKCTCEFYYVSYGDDPLEEAVGQRSVPQPPPDEPVWSHKSESELVNSFSLVHHDLNICTNSLQYSVIFDVINNLLLFVDPVSLSKTENFMRTKYKLMLSNIEDQKKPILHLQNNLRQLICQLRRTERTIYHVKNGSLMADMDRLEQEIAKIKELVVLKSEELEIRLRCYHDFQLSQNRKQALPFSDGKADLRQKSEILFSRAQWRLTETDGQLGIADVTISKFSYTKSNMKDETTEHLLEMGHVLVKNLLQDQLYTNVLSPTTLHQNVPVDLQRTLRVFCREKAPVGGISVKDHFEINLVPLTIGITQSFYKKLIAFCFPDRGIEAGEASEAVSSGKKSSSSGDLMLSNATTKKKNSSNFYVESPLRSDDVEQMKERAKLNKLFVYIKIPEVPICVSFKSEKEKNKILDVSNFLLQVPTIEYHNVTWTWLDLLMAVKSQTKDSLISQAIKQKLTIKSTKGHKDAVGVGIVDDEEKAKMLLGSNALFIGNRKK